MHTVGWYLPVPTYMHSTVGRQLWVHVLMRCSYTQVYSEEEEKLLVSRGADFIRENNPLLRSSFVDLVHNFFMQLSRT